MKLDKAFVRRAVPILMLVMMAAAATAIASDEDIYTMQPPVVAGVNLFFSDHMEMFNRAYQYDPSSVILNSRCPTDTQHEGEWAVSMEVRCTTENSNEWSGNKYYKQPWQNYINCTGTSACQYSNENRMRESCCDSQCLNPDNTQSCQRFYWGPADDIFDRWCEWDMMHDDSTCSTPEHICNGEMRSPEWIGADWQDWCHARDRGNCDQDCNSGQYDSTDCCDGCAWYEACLCHTTCLWCEAPPSNVCHNDCQPGSYLHGPGCQDNGNLCPNYAHTKATNYYNNNYNSYKTSCQNRDQGAYFSFSPSDCRNDSNKLNQMFPGIRNGFPFYSFVVNMYGPREEDWSLYEDHAIACLVTNLWDNADGDGNHWHRSNSAWVIPFGRVHPTCPITDLPYNPNGNWEYFDCISFDAFNFFSATIYSALTDVLANSPANKGALGLIDNNNFGRDYRYGMSRFNYFNNQSSPCQATYDCDGQGGCQEVEINNDNGASIVWDTSSSGTAGASPGTPFPDYTSVELKPANHYHDFENKNGTTYGYGTWWMSPTAYPRTLPDNQSGSPTLSSNNNHPHWTLSYLQNMFSDQRGTPPLWMTEWEADAAGHGKHNIPKVLSKPVGGAFDEIYRYMTSSTTNTVCGTRKTYQPWPQNGFVDLYQKGFMSANIFNLALVLGSPSDPSTVVQSAENMWGADLQADADNSCPYANATTTNCRRQSAATDIITINSGANSADTNAWDTWNNVAEAAQGRVFRLPNWSSAVDGTNVSGWQYGLMFGEYASNFRDTYMWNGSSWNPANDWGAFACRFWNCTNGTMDCCGFTHWNIPKGKANNAIVGYDCRNATNRNSCWTGLSKAYMYYLNTYLKRNVNTARSFSLVTPVVLLDNEDQFDCQKNWYIDFNFLTTPGPMFQGNVIGYPYGDQSNTGCPLPLYTNNDNTILDNGGVLDPTTDSTTYKPFNAGEDLANKAGSARTIKVVTGGALADFNPTGGTPTSTQLINATAGSGAATDPVNKEVSRISTVVKDGSKSFYNYGYGTAHTVKQKYYKDAGLGWKLGDVFHSQPVVVKRPSPYYSDVPIVNLNTSSQAVDAAYSTFVANNVTRAPMLYVGADDGAIHAFDISNAIAGSSPKTVENWAIIPNIVIPKLKNLTPEGFMWNETLNYNQLNACGENRMACLSGYACVKGACRKGCTTDADCNSGEYCSNSFCYVTISSNDFRTPLLDASPAVADVWAPSSSTAQPPKSASDWKTYLATGVGMAGKQVLVLDVTSTTSPGYVMEFNADPTGASTDMHVSKYLGYTTSAPVIGKIKVCTGDCSVTSTGGGSTANIFERWVAIFGAGYSPYGDPADPDISYCDAKTAKCDPVRNPTAFYEGRGLIILDLVTKQKLFEYGYQLEYVSIQSNGSGVPVSSDVTTAECITDRNPQLSYYDTGGNVIGSDNGKLRGPVGIDHRKCMKYALAAPPTAVDYNGDGYIDAVYIGDLGGQIWKFDLSNIGKTDYTGKGGMVQVCDTSSPTTFGRFIVPNTTSAADGTGGNSTGTPTCWSGRVMFQAQAANQILCGGDTHSDNFLKTTFLPCGDYRCALCNDTNSSAQCSRTVDATKPNAVCGDRRCPWECRDCFGDPDWVLPWSNSSQDNTNPFGFGSGRDWHSFWAAPTISQDNFGRWYVFMGSGDRTNLLRTAQYKNGALFAVYDHMKINPLEPNFAVQEYVLFDPLHTDDNKPDGISAWYPRIRRVANNTHIYDFDGWYREFTPNSSGNDTCTDSSGNVLASPNGVKIIGSPAVAGNDVYFAAFVPTPAYSVDGSGNVSNYNIQVLERSRVGSACLYVADMVSGGRPLLQLNSGNTVKISNNMFWAGMKIGYDIPSSPKVVTRTAGTAGKPAETDVIVHTSAGDVQQIKAAKTKYGRDILSTQNRIIYWRESM